MGQMRWVASAGSGTLLVAPVLTVRDKGRLPEGQAVTWVIPSDGITLLAPEALSPGDFHAQVVEARHLGEITLATLALAAVPGAPLRLTLSGVQRQGLVVGAPLCVRLDMDKVHVMPVRSA
jgi:molybdate transport system ATP-binding protein